MLMNRSPHSPVSVQQNFKIEDEEDLRHDFERLQQAMEMVGFLSATKKQ
jgi:myosin-9